MKNIQLLDCTLRDGGYVNDWKFGKKNLVSVFERLIDAKVDIIEIGFLNGNRPFDEDRSIMPDTESVSKIYGNLDRKDSKIFGMIDFGTCPIENIQEAKDSFLDGIRVIFKKGKMYPAMEYCREIKNKGYKVFSNLVSITSYADDELLELIRIVNDVKPYGVSMVDTYGLLNPDSLLHIYKIIDDNLDKDIKIGFHAHNNFQLGYANALAFIKYKGKHDIVVDGTLYGMGKSAGNDPIELVAMTLNDEYGKDYNIDSMLESINESLMEIYQKSPWGYNTFFYLCAKNKCHPNYLTDYYKEENLSVGKLNQLLAIIEPDDKKLLYDKDISRQCYEKYIAECFNDGKTTNNFLDFLGNRKILLIGPGKNIKLQESKVKHFIEKEKPVIISVNYLPDAITTDCVFITNPKRYHDMTLSLKAEKNSCVKTLATTNVSCRNGAFDFVVNRSPLLEKDEKIIDNSFLMLVKYLNCIGIKEIYCAGFDGYSDRECNYSNPEMEYAFIKNEARHLNSHMKKSISTYRKSMYIEFITYSAYDMEDDINGASI